MIDCGAAIGLLDDSAKAIRIRRTSAVPEGKYAPWISNRYQLAFVPPPATLGTTNEYACTTNTMPPSFHTIFRASASGMLELMATQQAYQHGSPTHIQFEMGSRHPHIVGIYPHLTMFLTLSAKGSKEWIVREPLLR